MAECVLERLRRKTKPNNSTRKLFPQEKLQVWSSTLGLKVLKVIKQRPKLHSCVTFLFLLSVNIAANSTVVFVLTYEELLQRKTSQFEILTRVTPELPV